MSENIKRTAAAVAVVIVCAAVFLLVPKKKEETVYIYDALGTVSEITVYGKNTDSLSLCREYVYKMDSLFSVTDPESEISRINRGERVKLSRETEEILNFSMKYADNETFNPFCGTLIELWDDAKAKNIPPKETDVTLAASYSYPFSLKIENHEARLENKGQKINLGAVAKGYITDGIADILEENGVGSALINLGGNVYAKGKRPDGKLWQIGVRSPESESEYLGVLSVADMAVVTSGDYERYFEYEGVRYHHILDPKTGRPAKSGLRSVTVICKDAALADMLSTKCFIAGFEEGAKILKDFGAYGIFVTEEHDVFYSAGLDEIFIPQSDDYKYMAF